MKRPDDKILLETAMEKNIFKIERWTLEFMTTNYENALLKMTEYLHSLKKRPEYTEALLMQFLVEFIYNIKTILQYQHLAIWTEAMLNNELIGLFRHSLHSAEDMENYLRAMSKYLDTYRTPADCSPNMAIDNVTRYIRGNLKNPLSRSELAKLAHMHPDHLSHTFHRQMGISLREYIVRERISYAKYLLSHTHLNISAIALECGYENAAYFSKLFKKTTGMMPKEYRNHAVSDSGISH